MLCAAVGSAQIVAPERIGDLATLAEGSARRSCSSDQFRRHCLGEWHLVRGELHEALQVIAPATASARRRGELSGVVPRRRRSTPSYSKRSTAPKAAARLTGQLPRRWSMFHTTHIESFHQVLEQRLDAQTRRRLAAEGSSTPLDELLELAPTALRCRAQPNRSTAESRS